jgi:DNA-binding MarR family transcriptional regulator
MEKLNQTASLLRPLLISKTRAKLLAIFLNSPGKIFYVRELVRAVDEQINAVRAELARMEKAGMVNSENRANRKFYGFRKDYIFQTELAGIIAKASGLGTDVISERNKLGKIKFATLSSGFIHRRPASANEVDLLVVGNVVLPQLAAIVKKAEDKIGREVNYTVMSEDEFTFRKRRKDPFVTTVIEKIGVVLVGDEEDLLK